MIATKSLPTNRVATLAQPGRGLLNPKYDRARHLYRQGKDWAWSFAAEIEHLREEYLQDKNANLIPGGRSISHDEKSSGEDGFVATLGRELEISTATAYRYLNLVKAVRYCQQIEQAPAGDVIELDGGDSFKVTEKAQEKAKELREEIVTGGVPMNRALPAVKGLFIPGGSRGGKAATDHSKNCKAAMAKWATSLEHYYDFPTADREYLDATFGELLANGVIPESWLVMVAKQTKGGRK